jgi:hypothetical protein
MNPHEREQNLADLRDSIPTYEEYLRAKCAGRYERVGFLTGFGWGWFTACLATSIYFLFLRG